MNMYHVLAKVPFKSDSPDTQGPESKYHYCVEANNEGDAIRVVKEICHAEDNSPDAQFTVKRATMIENLDAELAPPGRIYCL